MSKDTCKSEVCPYHNCALFGTAKVVGEMSDKVDNQESFSNKLHDDISILTKRVEHLEQRHEKKRKPKFQPANDPVIR